MSQAFDGTQAFAQFKLVISHRWLSSAFRTHHYLSISCICQLVALCAQSYLHWMRRSNKNSPNPSEIATGWVGALVENSIHIQPSLWLVRGSVEWMFGMFPTAIWLILPKHHIRDSHSQIKINLPHPELLVLLQINVNWNILFVHIWPIYLIWSGAISDGRRDISNRRTNSKFRTTDSKWYAMKWHSVWKARKSNFFFFVR